MIGRCKRTGGGKRGCNDNSPPKSATTKPAMKNHIHASPTPMMMPVRCEKDLGAVLESDANAKGYETGSAAPIDCSIQKIAPTLQNIKLQTEIINHREGVGGDRGHAIAFQI